MENLKMKNAISALLVVIIFLTYILVAKYPIVFMYLAWLVGYYKQSFGKNADE